MIRISSFRTLLTAGVVGLSTALLAPSALACGGFFCSRTAPVFQSAERIIFAQEGENVTQIVEVLYEGPSERFSWVLPVPGVPVPDVSSKQVFDRLDAATAPQYVLQRDYACFEDLYYGDGDAIDLAGSPGADDGAIPPVTILDAGSVGPFDYETISVNVDKDPADTAIEWLTENGYDVTDETGEVLGPYLENGLNLIAFRLQKGQSTGAIRPIVLEYQASRMAIPIRPTSVAANDDMPVLVWILGEDRAVPTNYYGLEVNELLIDWFNPASSYNNVVTAAANEAGGQGFVTELVTEASTYVDAVKPAPEDIDRVFESVGDFENTLMNIVRQLGTWDGFLETASKHIVLRDGVTMEAFTSCSYCYFHPQDYPEDLLADQGFSSEPITEDDPIYDTDLEALEESLRDTVIAPLLRAGDLLQSHRKITRLYTTMSADEMSLDPVFQFNPDLEDVSNTHTAVQEMDDPDQCSNEKWTITLEDGTKVYGEGEEWPHALGNTELSANARIISFSTSGPGKVVDDMMEDNMTEHEKTDAGHPPEDNAGGGDDTSEANASGGGGCSVSERNPGPDGSWLAALSLLGLLWSRRRRQSAR